MRLSLKNWLFVGATLTALLSQEQNGVVASGSVNSPSPPSTVAPNPPFVGGKILVNGVVQEVESDMATLGKGVGEMKLSDVYGCCTITTPEECADDQHEKQRLLSRAVIGAMPQFTKDQALQALQSAVTAWRGGSGSWPQMPLNERINAIQTFMKELKHKREEIVNVLMWEIGKNRLDAEAEFDRTMKFAEKTIEYIVESHEFGKEWDTSNGSTRLFLSRAAVGIVLCLGPYNYPLNETYATLIPALLMGNVVILKIPTLGGLAHLLTMEAFSKALPPGTINLISGSGRTTMPPLMESGKIDSLAFIGGSRAADNLIKAHPEPHRLKLFLQLEAKNMGIYLPDLFENDIDGNVWEKVMAETLAGTLSYNGQRCTALKLLFVPKEHAQNFAAKVAEKVESLPVGLPWEMSTASDGKQKYSQITPLPNQARVEYMKALIDDAVEKGAKIMNENGGMLVGGGIDNESTLMVPAILYPVTPEMRIWEEEQFGPVVPIAPYDSLDDVTNYAREGKYGQQVSIFTSSTGEADSAGAAQLVDRFSTVFGKININSQCGRSPDTAPFSGRRSSAMGVMSVVEALHEFSIPTVVAYKDSGNTGEVMNAIEKQSNFLKTVR